MLIIDALLAPGAPALRELSLGLNAAPHPPLLVAAVGRLLAVPASPLHTLALAGGAGFRLKHELTMLLAHVARAADAGGARLTSLDVSGHQCGDAMVEVLAPLLTGAHAPPSLLLHDNGLTLRGLEQLGDVMTRGEGRCATELLVVTHEDARSALQHEVGLRRHPKEPLPAGCDYLEGVFFYRGE